MRRLLAVISISLALMACGATDDEDASSADDESGASTTTVVQSPGQSLARDVGCESTTVDDWEYWSGRWAFDESLTCDIDGDGGDELWLHIFVGERRGFVKEQFDLRFDVAPGVDDCAGDPVPVGDWVLLGPEWAVTSTRENLIRRLSERFEGEILAGGPGVGPPVSYPTLEPCQ